MKKNNKKIKWLEQLNTLANHETTPKYLKIIFKWLYELCISLSWLYNKFLIFSWKIKIVIISIILCLIGISIFLLFPWIKEQKNIYLPASSTEKKEIENKNKDEIPLSSIKKELSTKYRYFGQVTEENIGLGGIEIKNNDGKILSTTNGNGEFDFNSTIKDINIQYRIMNNKPKNRNLIEGYKNELE